MENKIINDFHILYYEESKRTWSNTFWMGVGVQKTPLDLWIYQEILHEVKPDIIIETGTFDGGSAYYLAHICDIIGCGYIITIDIEEHPSRPKHDRISYYHGSSTDPRIIHDIELFSQRMFHKKTLVILDSDHTRQHVLEEMKLYSKFVTKDSYLIVEDSNINGHPVRPNWGEGPYEAITEFMKGRSDFIIDLECEKFFMTHYHRLTIL